MMSILLIGIQCRKFN